MDNAIRAAVSGYFTTHKEVFLALFKAITNSREILKCVEFSLAVEKSYDCFPALPLLISSTGERIFADDAPDNLGQALSSLSHLPNLFDEETLDPDQWDMELDDGTVVPIAIFVRDLLAEHMNRLVPDGNQVPIRIGVQGSGRKVDILKP